MMTRANRAVSAFLAVSFAAVAAWASAPPPPPAADASFDSFWHDGKAELDGYFYTVTRYGQRRRGQCVAIFVTEPFGESKRVKVDDPAKDPKDAFDALKLNLVRDFQTGIYDYNTMVSTFVRSATFDPMKVSFSSAEWCGHVYEELLFDPGWIRERFFSYFEGESASGEIESPRGGVAEDNLFILLRGLRGGFLRPGERRRAPFLAGAFYRRLTHQPLRWSSAEIERVAAPQRVSVPAGAFATILYVVRTAEGREGRIHIERAYPHRVVQWEWKLNRSPATPRIADGLDAGKLTGSRRLEYWKLHDGGNESYLKQLGLPVPAR